MAVRSISGRIAVYYSKELHSCLRHQSALAAVASDDPSMVAAAKSHKKMPGPKSLLGGGLMLMLGLKEIDRNEMFKLHKQYGDIVRLKMAPGMYTVHLFDPDDMEFVYRNEGQFPIRMELETQYAKDKKLPFGIISADGSYWNKLRKAVNKQLMRPKAISAYLPAQEPIADDLIKRIYNLKDGNGEVPEFMLELNHYAMEAVSVVLFAKRLYAVSPIADPPAETTEFIHAAQTVFEAMQTLLLNIPLHKFITTPTYRKYKENADIMLGTLMRYIQDTVARSETGDIRCGLDVEDSVALSILRSGITNQEAMMVMFDIMFAGVDTTSNFLGFCLHYLATNPDAQEKLYQEVHKEAPQGRPVTESALNRMPYLKAVCKESHRLTPIAATIPRILEKDVTIKGYRIPAGEMMMMEHGVSSRQSSLYENADSFWPDRWLRQQRQQQTHPFSIMPFGFGRRMCLGRRLAEQEIHILLIKLMQNFRIEYHHEPIEAATRLVAIPDKPLRFSFIERDV